MHTISEAGGHTVAGDIASAFAEIDQTLAAVLRMATSVAETNAASKIVPVALQKSLRSIHAGIGNALDLRDNIIATQRSLIALKDKSNLEVVDLGCLDFFTKGDASKLEVIAQA
jgi:hypothetical protein